MKFQWRAFLAGALVGLLVALFLVIGLASGPWTALSVAGAILVIVLAYLGKAKEKGEKEGEAERGL